MERIPFFPSGITVFSPKISKNHIEPDYGEAMESIKEIWGYLRERKKYWLLPIILTMLLFGGLIFLTSGSAIAPFIYTLF